MFCETWSSSLVPGGILLSLSGIHIRQGMEDQDFGKRTGTTAHNRVWQTDHKRTDREYLSHILSHILTCFLINLYQFKKFLQTTGFCHLALVC